MFGSDLSGQHLGIEVTPVIYDKEKKHATLSTVFSDGEFYDYVVEMFVEPLAKAKVDLSMLYSPLKITACCEIDSNVTVSNAKQVLRKLTDMFYNLCAWRGSVVYGTILEMLGKDEDVEDFFHELGTIYDLEDASAYCQKRIHDAVEFIPEEVKYAIFIQYPQKDVEDEVLTNMNSDELLSLIRKQAIFSLELSGTKFGTRVMPEGCIWSDVYQAAPSISQAVCNIKHVFSLKAIDGETNGELPFYPSDGEMIISSDWAKRKLAKVGEFTEFLKRTHETQALDLDNDDEPSSLFTSVECECYDFMDPRVESAFELYGASCQAYLRPGRIVIFADSRPYDKKNKNTPGQMLGYMRTIAACVFYDMALRSVSQYIEDLQMVAKSSISSELYDELMTRATDYGVVYEHELAQLYKEIPYGIDFTVFVEPIQGMTYAKVMMELPGGELKRADEFRGEDMHCTMVGDAVYNRKPVSDNDIDSLRKECVAAVREYVRENPHIAMLSEFQSFSDIDELVRSQYDDNVVEHFGRYDGGKTALCVADIAPGALFGIDEHLCDVMEQADEHAFKRHRRIIAIATVSDDETEEDAKEAARNAAKAMFYREERKAADKYIALLESLKNDLDKETVDDVISQCREYADAVKAHGGLASISISDTTLFMAADQEYDKSGYSILSCDDTINSAPRDAIKEIYDDLVATYLKDDSSDVAFINES